MPFIATGDSSEALRELFEGLSNDQFLLKLPNNSTAVLLHPVRAVLIPSWWLFEGVSGLFPLKVQRCVSGFVQSPI